MSQRMLVFIISLIGMIVMVAFGLIGVMDVIFGILLHIILTQAMD